MTRSTLIAEDKFFHPDKVIRLLIMEELFPFIVELVLNSNSMNDVRKNFKERITDASAIKKFENLIQGSKELNNEELTIVDIKILKGL